jgi:hypothetical protein
MTQKCTEWTTLKQRTVPPDLFNKTLQPVTELRATPDTFTGPYIYHILYIYRATEIYINKVSSVIIFSARLEF